MSATITENSLSVRNIFSQRLWTSIIAPFGRAGRVTPRNVLLGGQADNACLLASISLGRAAALTRASEASASATAALASSTAASLRGASANSAGSSRAAAWSPSCTSNRSTRLAARLLGGPSRLTRDAGSTRPRADPCGERGQPGLEAWRVRPRPQGPISLWRTRCRPGRQSRQQTLWGNPDPVPRSPGLPSAAWPGRGQRRAHRSRRTSHRLVDSRWRSNHPPTTRPSLVWPGSFQYRAAQRARTPTRLRPVPRMRVQPGYLGSGHKRVTKSLSVVHPGTLRVF